MCNHRIWIKHLCILLIGRPQTFARQCNSSNALWPHSTRMYPYVMRSNPFVRYRTGKFRLIKWLSITPQFRFRMPTQKPSNEFRGRPRVGQTLFDGCIDILVIGRFGRGYEHIRLVSFSHPVLFILWEEMCVGSGLVEVRNAFTMCQSLLANSRR